MIFQADFSFEGVEDKSVTKLWLYWFFSICPHPGLEQESGKYPSTQRRLTMPAFDNNCRWSNGGKKSDFERLVLVLLSDTTLALGRMIQNVLQTFL